MRRQSNPFDLASGSIQRGTYDAIGIYCPAEKAFLLNRFLPCGAIVAASRL
jgi:hypothetical protein